jgi:hypothetical protein
MSRREADGEEEGGGQEALRHKAVFHPGECNGPQLTHSGPGWKGLFAETPLRFVRDLSVLAGLVPGIHALEPLH